MSSSDLELARALSRLLSEPPAGARRATPLPPLGGVEPADPSRFLRFREVGRPAAAPPTPEAAPAPEPASPAPPPRIDSRGFGAGVFTPLLEWGLGAAAADAVFLMDPHGLVVASIGPLGAGEAEAFGARLMVSLEHARAMAGPDPGEAAVVVEAGGRTLSAFAAVAFDGTELTIGFSGASPVSRPVREAMCHALAGG